MSTLINLFIDLVFSLFYGSIDLFNSAFSMFITFPVELQIIVIAIVTGIACKLLSNMACNREAPSHKIRVYGGGYLKRTKYGTIDEQGMIDNMLENYEEKKFLGIF